MQGLFGWELGGDCAMRVWAKLGKQGMMQEACGGGICRSWPLPGRTLGKGEEGVQGRSALSFHQEDDKQVVEEKAVKISASIPCLWWSVRIYFTRRLLGYLLWAKTGLYFCWVVTFLT